MISTEVLHSNLEPTRQVTFFLMFWVLISIKVGIKGLGGSPFVFYILSKVWHEKDFFENHCSLLSKMVEIGDEKYHMDFHAWFDSVKAKMNFFLKIYWVVFSWICTTRRLQVGFITIKFSVKIHGRFFSTILLTYEKSEMK